MIITNPSHMEFFGEVILEFERDATNQYPYLIIRVINKKLINSSAITILEEVLLNMNDSHIIVKYMADRICELFNKTGSQKIFDLIRSDLYYKTTIEKSKENFLFIKFRIGGYEPELSYIRNDIISTNNIIKILEEIRMFNYKKVIFNKPATIIIWEDGTKTIVKCKEGEAFDPEKGIALCFMKRALGNKGSYNDILKRELKHSNSDEMMTIANANKLNKKIEKICANKTLIYITEDGYCGFNNKKYDFRHSRPCDIFMYGVDMMMNYIKTIIKEEK